MGRYKCSADNCESSSETDIKFFKFPLYNPKKLKKWLLSMNREDWTPSRFSVLCINHFEEQLIDRSGKSITLKEDAVPTIFTPSDSTQCQKQPQLPSYEDTMATPRSKSGRPRGRPPKSKEPVLASTIVPEIVTVNTDNEEVVQEEELTTEGESETPKWSIIVDEDLQKINSFPHFFHGSYCASQDIQWAPDESANAEGVCYLIEVTDKWQWLGLDVRGPLPESRAGHKYVLSITDYFSKWIEAWPIESVVPGNLVQHIVEIIKHFGFPLRILSRLSLDTINEVNQRLEAQLKVEFPLVVHHQKTGSVDLTTQQIIDRMVNDLLEEHPSDWDVYLPAKVFSLCFKENSLTQQRPFTLLCCKGPEPVHSPRRLEMQDIDFKDCDFLVH